ncbi:DEAD-box ATP-dependent RNA helicase 42, partial [Ophiophagus hannah]
EEGRKEGKKEEKGKEGRKERKEGRKEGREGERRKRRGREGGRKERRKGRGREEGPWWRSGETAVLQANSAQCQQFDPDRLKVDSAFRPSEAGQMRTPMGGLENTVKWCMSLRAGAMFPLLWSDPAQLCLGILNAHLLKTLSLYEKTLEWHAGRNVAGLVIREPAQSLLQNSGRVVDYLQVFSPEEFSHLKKQKTIIPRRNRPILVFARYDVLIFHPLHLETNPSVRSHRREQTATCRVNQSRGQSMAGWHSAWQKRERSGTARQLLQKELQSE